MFAIPIVVARALALSATATMLGFAPANATPFFFSTGDPDGRMAAASRPSSGGQFEIETGDDFALTTATTLTSATFTGLIPTGSTVNDVVIEIYRVFPNDSDTGRTPQVPTRVNSPSDVAFDSRDSAAANLSFTTNTLAASFTASNSVAPGGIHPAPNQTTLGDGSVTGQEVEFDVNFSALLLPADHYFFVPQVQLDTGDFLWLSAPRPIVPPGTAFPAGVTDLQAWTRDEFLDPDWLRIGTDIVGSSTFNMTFSLTGDVPEPASLLLFAVPLAALGWQRLRRP